MNTQWSATLQLCCAVLCCGSLFVILYGCCYCCSSIVVLGAFETSWECVWAGASMGCRCPVLSALYMYCTVLLCVGIREERREPAGGRSVRVYPSRLACPPQFLSISISVPFSLSVFASSSTRCIRLFSLCVCPSLPVGRSGILVTA